jgi:O-antigen ligase
MPNLASPGRRHRQLPRRLDLGKSCALLLALGAALLASMVALTEDLTTSIILVALPLGALVLSLPLTAVLWALVVTRALSDYGTYTLVKGADAEGRTVSLLLGLIALAVMATRAWKASPLSVRRLFVGVVAYVLVWGAVACLNYGIDRTFVAEQVRLVSIAAVVVIGAACVRQGDHNWRAPLVAGLIPAILVLFGIITGKATMVDGEGRAFGAFSHPNSAAAYLLVLLIVGVATVWGGRATTNGRIWLASGILGVALLSTQSMAAIGGLLAGLVVLGWTTGGKVLSRRLRGLIALAGLTGAAMAIFPEVISRVTGLGTTRSFDAVSSGVTTNSLDWRFYNWLELLGAWRERPWFGHGLGTTKSIVQPGGNLPHSVPFQILIEGGLVGFLIVTTAAILIWRRSLLHIKTSTKPSIYTQALPAVFTALALDSIASNLLGYTSAMFAAAAVCGLAASFTDATNLEQRDVSQKQPDLTGTGPAGWASKRASSSPGISSDPRRAPWTRGSRHEGRQRDG